MSEQANNVCATNTRLAFNILSTASLSDSYRPVHINSFKRFHKSIKKQYVRNQIDKHKYLESEFYTTLGILFFQMLYPNTQTQFLCLDGLFWTIHISIFFSMENVVSGTVNVTNS